MDINSTAPSLREILLGRNIISDSITNNGLAALVEGISSLVSIGHHTPNVQPSEDIELLGELYRDLLIVNNKHQGSLDDHRRISIITLPNDETGEEPYNPTHADLIEDSLLRGDLNLINNKYRNVLGETQIIDVKFVPQDITTVSEYGSTSGKLGHDEDSEQYRKDNTTKSKYLDWDAQLLKDIITTPVVTDKNLPNYKTRMEGILGKGDGSVASAAASVMGKLLGGTQPNYSVGEPNPVFDIQGILSNSDIDETPLGVNAAEGLNNAILANIGANLYEETIGNINTNPLSVLMGNDIIVPNYSITVAKGTFGGLLDYSEKILGLQVPVSLLSQSSSIFQSENPVPNVQRANSLIENTGKGQILSLFANLRASLLNSNSVKSGYAPGFVDKRDPNGGINPNIYAFADNEGGVIDFLHGTESNPIAQSNYNDKLAANSGFKGIENVKSEVLDGTAGQVDFTWSDQYLGVYTNTDFEKKSILWKTQNLFNQADRMVNLTTGKYAKATQGETNTTVDSAAGTIISKGSAVRRFNDRLPETDPDRMFNRAWTTFDRYDRVENLQKHATLDYKAGVNERSLRGESVLDDNGFVKISDYGDIDGEATVANLRGHMFSIENLAWADDLTKLMPSEIGRGDTVTGKKGRVMWFPPYEMNFNDNTSVNWESTDFIGRGEPIYTYNNTTRIGTLQFKIIIDHPSYMNNLKGESDQLIDSFFAGEFDVDDRVKSKLSADEIATVEVKRNQEIDDVNHTPTATPEPFSVFFPYNSNTIQPVNVGYEEGANFNFVTNPQGIDEGLGTYTDMDGITRNDNTNFTQNDIYWEVIEDIGDKLKECPACKITITTYGATNENNLARFQRAQVIYNEMVAFNDPNDPVKEKRYELVDGGVLPVQLFMVNPSTGIPSPLPLDTESVKSKIKVSVKFQFDAKLAEELNPQKKRAIPQADSLLNQGLKNRFYNELGFFKKLQQDDKVVYDSISEKIGFFHPAFHSITPEGFNSRLTFLQQCTRQGPTLSDNHERPDNLAFGKPPVCILRIGDFYHTKIVIDNLSFSYEPLVWDLNPEGVGVQPMICTVDMQFAFIGGSSMKGPINKLQNAVSFNFFANTEIYDPRADWISGDEVISGVSPDETGKAAASSTNGGGNTNAPVTNQAATAAAAVGPTQPPTAPTGTAAVATTAATATVPTITGFDGIQLQLMADGAHQQTYGVRVSVKTEAIYSGSTLLLTTQELNDFVGKGVKLTLISPAGTLKANEVVPLTGSDGKSWNFLSGGLGYPLGETVQSGIGIRGMFTGDYQLKLEYNGQTIANKVINIHGQTSEYIT